MIALENFKNSRISSKFLFGLGVHLGVNGLLVLVVYYFVAQISIQDARELLAWTLPAAQGSCIVAALLVFASMSVRNPEAGPAEQTSSRGWIIGKISPWGNAPRSVRRPTLMEQKKAAAANVARVLSVMKVIDWIVFRDLAMAYFRELGFRVVDRPCGSTEVDFLLFLPNDNAPVAVRCLPFAASKVDLKQVRSVHRAMLLAGASQGVLLTTGTFAEEAVRFCEGTGFELVGGESFAARMLALPNETSQKLLDDAAGAESIRRGIQVGL